MEYIQELLNGPQRYIIFLIIGVMVLYIPYMIFATKRHKKKAQQYLQAHPDAAKVMLIQKIAGIVSESLVIISVNGEKPVMFTEKGKSGFYALPGENTIELSYSWTRPGVLHKNVTYTIDPGKQQITVEAGKSYGIRYDRDEEHYVFEAL